MLLSSASGRRIFYEAVWDSLPVRGTCSVRTSKRRRQLMECTNISSFAMTRVIAHLVVKKVFRSPISVNR